MTYKKSFILDFKTSKLSTFSAFDFAFSTDSPEKISAQAKCFPKRPVKLIVLSANRENEIII